MTSIYRTFEAIRDREQIYDRIEADNPTAAIDLDALFEQKVGASDRTYRVGPPRSCDRHTRTDRPSQLYSGL